MKTLIALVILVLVWSHAAGQAPAPETIADFEWTSAEVDSLNRSSAFEGNFFKQATVQESAVLTAGGTEKPLELTINYALTRSLQLTIRTLGPAIASKVTAKHYAITGKMRYEGVPAGSYLEMWSYFAPTTPGGPQGAYFSRTLADSGPMAKMEGTDDARDFELPFDATGTTAQLERVEFNLHLTGPGNVHLWNVKLVQYPDAPPLVRVPDASASVPAPAEAPIIVSLTDHAPNPAGFSLDGTDYPTLDPLPATLATRHQATPGATVTIQAGRTVRHDDVVRAIDAVKEAGFQTAHVALKPDVAATPAQAAAASGQVGDLVSLENARALCWMFFFAGMVTTALVVLLASGLSFLFRRIRHRQKERELRRIASLDG